MGNELIDNRGEGIGKTLVQWLTENGVKYPANLTANYFILSGNQTTGRLELRCKELFLLSDSSKKAGYTLLAGLTPVNFFPTLTGSDGYKGVG